MSPLDRKADARPTDTRPAGPRPPTDRPAGSRPPTDRPAGSRPDVGAISMLSDRVLVHVPRAEGERTSRAGILIPATAQVAKRLTWAEANAVGPLVRTVAVGDQVLFHHEEAFEVEVRGDDYLILRERDIHATASPRGDGAGTGLYL